MADIIARALAKKQEESLVEVNRQLTEVALQLEERPVRMKKALIYYGFPTAVNAAWSVSGAIGVYQTYDIVVLGDQYNDPAHESYTDTVAVIAGLLENKPTIELFGYVPIGNNTSNSLSISEIQTRIDWWFAIGATGIFLDEFGYDYLVTRERQNLSVQYAHDLGMNVFVNSWNDDYVFSNALNSIEWLPDFEPNPAGLPSLLTDSDYSLYENLFWSVEQVNGVLTGNTIGGQIWQIHRPYNYRYAPKAEFGGKSYSQQYGTQIVSLDGFHHTLDDAMRKQFETVSIFAAKILNINAVAFGDQFWGSQGQIVNWNLPNYDLNERTHHVVSVKNKLIEDELTPYAYSANVNGVNLEVVFDIDSATDTSYTPEKRYLTVDGNTVLDAWDTLFAVRGKVDGFESQLNTVVGEVETMVQGVSNDVASLGNLTTLTNDLQTLKTEVETTETNLTQSVNNSIASLELIVSGFQYSLREW